MSDLLYCSSCEEEKPKLDFYKDNTRPNRGYRYQCKKCLRPYEKSRYNYETKDRKIQLLNKQLKEKDKEIEELKKEHEMHEQVLCDKINDLIERLKELESKK